jgi:hypothetical protein
LKETLVMRRIPVLGVGLLVLLAGPSGASEKEALAVIEQAVKAQGGASAMEKAQQCKRSDAGMQALGGREVPFTSEVTRSLPHKVRLKIELDKKKLITTIVLNGDKGWQTEGGPAVQMFPQRLKELREEAYVWWLATLAPLTKPKTDFTLSTIPDVKVAGEPAAGVKVVRKGFADTKMYFLKRNNLLAKIERRTAEAGLPVDKEYFYSAYKEFDGVKLPTKEMLKVNGRKWTELTISDYTFPAKLDAATFAKP